MPPERTLLDYLSGGQYQRAQDIPPMIQGPRMSQAEMLTALHSLDEILNPPLPQNVQAPGLGFAEYIDTGPIIGMKALAGLVGKGGKKGKTIRDFLKPKDLPKQGSIELQEGYVRRGKDPIPLLEDGSTPKYLYRAMSEAEWQNALKDGYLTPSKFYERTHASATPELTWLDPEGGRLVRIEYDKADDWVAKLGGDEVYAATSKNIPLSRLKASPFGDKKTLIEWQAEEGLSKLQKTAKKIFGTTDDAAEAGYILDDGSMLDFSGKSEGGTRGVRAYDHRQINQVGDSGVGGLDEFDDVGMDEFMEAGAIRWAPESEIVHINGMPSEKQLGSLRKIFNDRAKESFGHGEFSLLLNDTKGAYVGSGGHANYHFYQDYSHDIPWKTIERDIRQFFKTGKGPSITQQFHR